MLRVFLVVGTRPEIVKMAPIVHECEKRDLDHFLLHTGQHYSDNMSKSFFDELSLRAPDKNLDIGSGSHSEQTAKALIGIEKELISYQPDVVLVQGDTNAVLSATLASVKLNIPVGHVEAGLRSYDTNMPEEHNRRLTDHASKYLFAPTEQSANILEKENVWGEVYVTGNTVIDTLERIIQEFQAEPTETNGSDEFSLLTLHRAENVDDQKVLTGLIDGVSSLGDIVLFPAHPRTVARLNEFGLLKRIKEENLIRILEPLGYRGFLKLIMRSKYILTDSGGIKDEVTAPSIDKRAFVLRTSTERPEAVDSGHVTVVGTNPKVFPKTIKDVLKKGLLTGTVSPYGEGHAAEKIIDILEDRIPF
ncbi:MAG: non-hydrolyzing UDP-N-acetylglucosamine 2-epimerase [Candidatus Thorarchaeota archaeon]|jgi:UDP-N-acetylglucosamine 2-epimerase (non-hydrolysing)